MTIGWQINIGTILHLLGFTVVMVGVWIRLEHRMTAIETMLRPLWREFIRQRRANGDEC